MLIFEGAPVTVTHKMSEDGKILELRVHSPLAGRNLPEFIQILEFWLTRVKETYQGEIEALDHLVKSGKLRNIKDAKRGKPS